MTIRSGGRPRDTRDTQQAHPADHETYEKAWEPEYGSARDVGYGSRRGRNGSGNGNGYGRGRSGGGAGGLARFLAFALVLAAIVLLAFVTVLRPVVKGAVVGWASDNPGALGISFVADMVREDLGDRLTDAASQDTEQVQFQVGSGESATTIAARLEDEGFLADRRAFVLLAVERDLADQLKTGTFILRRSMTPDQLVTALLNPPENPYIDIALRTGLRLEQITAKLETIPGLEMNPADFYELAEHPTSELLADYPWLELPEGASLEGYLWPATYRVLPDTTPDELIRLMLDKFHIAIEDRMNVPASRGLTWRQVLTLASLVEREATLDEEKPLIAGVFQNRMDPKLFPNGHLGSDVTVFYVNDTIQLAAMPIEDWETYTFWTTLKDQLPADLPADLAGYNTYTSTGLMPGPIATPTIASIDAALHPDTEDHYLYFLAKKDGSNGTAFAKTHAEHEQNIAKYGN
jgi:UPF0755 protein